MAKIMFFPCCIRVIGRSDCGIYCTFHSYPIVFVVIVLRCYNPASPLISHRICYPGKGLTPQFSPFFRRYTREEYISEPFRGFISTL